MMDGIKIEDNVLTLIKKDEIILEKCAVEEHMVFHAHDFIEIVYISSGSGVHEIGDGSSSVVEQGDLMLFNSHVSHLFKVGCKGLEVYNCLFDPSVLRFAISKSDDFINIVYSCLFDSTGKSSVSKPYMILKGADRIFPIIYEMYTEYTAKTSGYEKINEANLVRLLVSIFRLQMRGEERGDSAFKRAIAESAILYMKEYCHEKITCETLASRAYLSTGYFHRVFKSVTGESPIDHLQNIRLEKAAAILSSSQATVKEAAAEAGYQDMKHFYRIFRKKYGVTPAQFKKSKTRG